MANNKVVCVHIARNEIRITEGRFNDGVILITRTATVQKANRFFNGGRLVFLADMVSAIINTMKVNSFTSKTVHLVYDNHVNVQLDVKDNFEISHRMDFSARDVGFSFTKKEKTPRSADTGIIVHKKAWGKFITETEQGEMTSTVTIERDLVDFLVSEFQSAGYKVASIEVPETAIMYLRRFVPYSYDAPHKIIVHAKSTEKDGKFYHFTKDAPADATSFFVDDTVSPAEYPAQLVAAIQEEIQNKNLINPHIILSGDAFANEELYIACCKALKEAMLSCIDIYALWRDKSAPINAIRVTMPGTDQEIDINGKYSLCIALLLRELESKPENLIEGFHPMFIRRGTKRTVIDLLFVTAACIMMWCLVDMGISVYEVYTAGREYDRASAATEATLRIAENARNDVKSQVDALNTIDKRYNEIFHFVYAQVSEDINIASVDTANLIPTDKVPQSAIGGNQGKPGSTNITVAGQEYIMQTIVIRGYSRTTNGPVELYNALVGAGLGEVKIVGVEQVELESGETLFAFELTVGTNEGRG